MKEVYEINLVLMNKNVGRHEFVALGEVHFEALHHSSYVFIRELVCLQTNDLEWIKLIKINLIDHSLYVLVYKYYISIYRQERIEFRIKSNYKNTITKLKM